MAIRGVTYNDDGAPGEKTPLLFRNDMDVRYATNASIVFGDQEGEFAEGNDPRLADMRVPADGSVTNDKMTDNAVGTAEIQDDAVTDAKLANDAVGTDQLKTGAVTNTKMANDSVGIPQIAATGTPSDTSFLRGDGTWAEGTTGVGDGAVTTPKLADNAVTNDKMADDAIGIAELSATGTPGANTFLRGDNTWATTPYDVYYMAFSALTPRAASSAGDNPMGIK